MIDSVRAGKRNGYQTSKDYKTIQELCHLFIQVICKGGRFLLNLGPNPDGSLDREEVVRLEGLGEWISRNKEAIHDTEAGPIPLSTRKKNTVYEFYLVETGWVYRTYRTE